MSFGRALGWVLVLSSTMTYAEKSKTFTKSMKLRMIFLFVVLNLNSSNSFQPSSLRYTPIAEFNRSFSSLVNNRTAAMMKWSVGDLLKPGSPESSMNMYCLFMRELYLMRAAISSMSRIFCWFLWGVENNCSCA